MYLQSTLLICLISKNTIFARNLQADDDTLWWQQCQLSIVGVLFDESIDFISLLSFKWMRMDLDWAYNISNWITLDANIRDAQMALNVEHTKWIYGLTHFNEMSGEKNQRKRKSFDVSVGDVLSASPFIFTSFLLRFRFDYILYYDVCAQIASLYFECRFHDVMCEW